MELQHVNVKFFVDGALTVDPEEFINVFHRWIREEACEEMLVDVADYRHVPEGPGVMLIGLQAEYSMDHSGGRWGLRYNRKDAVPGSNADRVHQALRAAAKACMALRAEFDAGAGLRFSNTEFELFVNDRALAPNTDETYGACSVGLKSAIGSALGHDKFNWTRPGDPRRRFGVMVTSAIPFDFNRLATLA